MDLSSAYLMLRNECNSGEDSEGEYGVRTTQSIVLIEKQKRDVQYSFGDSVWSNGSVEYVFTR